MISGVAMVTLKRLSVQLLDSCIDSGPSAGSADVCRGVNKPGEFGVQVTFKI